VIRSFGLKQDAVQLLKRVLIGLSVGSALFAAWLGISTYMLSKRRAEALESTKAHQASLSELRSVVSRAGARKADAIPEGFAAVSAFQAGIESCAETRSCTITEFQAGAEIMPFLTRFKKDTPASEWGQVEVQFSVRGKLVDVVNTVRSFSEQQVPFEYNSVDFNRVEVTRNGTATVSAKISLRVLTRVPGGVSA
jgi:hypothetical protein